MLLYGFHSVTARLRQSPASVKTLYLDRDRDDPRSRDLQKLAKTHGLVPTRIEAARLDRMCAGRRHQGVVAVVDAEVPAATVPALLERLAAEGREPFLLLLDGVTDPRNVGACLRVADGAGVQAVIAPKDHACQLTDTVIHTASGAAESVPYVLVTNLTRTIEDLQLAGIRVYAAADGAEAGLYDGPLTGPIAWVLGAEDKGVRRLVREQCDGLVSIPMRGRVESLNVSVAAGVVLYETLRQRLAAAPG